jgi:deazaflavin-dependent oxidoreductase (nitroreductase family)
MSRPGPATANAATPRGPGDPEPDLLDYLVVHRAMTVDSDRLAVAADELVRRPDRARMAALRRYLAGFAHEIESHHQVEDAVVWPVLEAVAGERAALVRLTDDHERLDPLLHRAQELAAGEPTPELAAVLRELADLLAAHIVDEERDVFPIIRECVRVEDYQALQARFRGNLNPRQLPFVVPWVVRHATPAEREQLVADADGPLRLLLRLFEKRFLARERLLFGGPRLTGKDRRTVWIMRWVGAGHVALQRLSGGRLANRWFGGSEIVLLTTTGRRSGKPHTVPVMSLRDGADILVPASRGGVDAEPHWWLNLEAEPRATAERQGKRFPVVAERVTDDERDAVWARFVAAYAGFEDYQAGVRRRIALVRLRPGP